MLSCAGDAAIFAGARGRHRTPARPGTAARRIRAPRSRGTPRPKSRKPRRCHISPAGDPSSGPAPSRAQKYIGFHHASTGRRQYTFDKQVSNVYSQAKEAVNYYLAPRNSPLTIGAALCGAFVYRRPDARHPRSAPALPPVHAGREGLGPRRLLRIPARHVLEPPRQPRARPHHLARSPRQPVVRLQSPRRGGHVRTLMAGMKLAQRWARRCRTLAWLLAADVDEATRRPIRRAGVEVRRRPTPFRAESTRSLFRFKAIRKPSRRH
jgi:hypothetical protein